MLIVTFVTVQIIIFGIFIYMFRKIMTQNVASATKHLDELSHDYDRKEQQVHKQLEEAEGKAQAIIDKAQEEVAELRARIAQEAQQEKERILAEARVHAEEIIRHADETRQQLLGVLDERIAKEAQAKACELLQEALPEDFKKEVHAPWVDDLIENGLAQSERLRVPAELNEVKVISAFALTEEQRRRIVKKIKDAVGRDVTINEEINPKLCAGFLIQIGELVLDGSLSNKIKRKARL
jgi:F-type H+-transporting ATPase subunit b